MSNSELRYFVVCALFLLLVLFQLPTLVGGAAAFGESHLCNLKGFLNQTDGSCNCKSPYYGRFCDLKKCPFGKSWMSRPITANVKEQPSLECSGNGVCNTDTGMCECRDLFTGRACDRLECPGTQIARGSAIPQPCSGHGRCRTIREAGLEFNGRSLIRPSVNYANWEADNIQGCVCDDGYEGYDCSQRHCPKGQDPMNPKKNAFTTPTLHLQCAADAGYFSILAKNQWTPPIPFDADATYLQLVLQRIQGIHSVTVETETAGSMSKLCSADNTAPFKTMITLQDYVGEAAPMLLRKYTSSTREWPSGDTVLSLAGEADDALLRFSTEYSLTCPACANCDSSIQFALGDSMSNAVMPMADTAADLASALGTISDLNDGNWGFTVAVSVLNDGNICHITDEIVTKISMYSLYGSLPALELVDEAMYDNTDTFLQDLTFSHSAGKGENFECSRQGFCDTTVGECRCFQAFDEETRSPSYLATTSNGFGATGGRGDCGYVPTELTTCIDGYTSCNSRGYCNSDGGCTCVDGWQGIACERKDCPTGAAWFDEPYSSSEAHRPAPCSNMGKCDITTGVCTCRVGFTGSACQRLDCPYNQVTGDHCSGHGWCLNINQLAALNGVEYGDIGNERYLPRTWDAFKVQGCVCSAEVAAGFDGLESKPAHGPRALISGIPATSTPLPGYSGYDCGQRNCPTGPDTSERYNLGGQVEYQRVICPLESGSFRLELFGFLSDSIPFNANGIQIRKAIEVSPAIRNITILFPNSPWDHIGRACDPSVSYGNGGFIVMFKSNIGDLPMMTADHPRVEVEEYLKGTGRSRECSGPHNGKCNRVTGKCECYPGFGSSNGSYMHPGDRGDCSYFIGLQGGASVKKTFGT